MPALVVAIGMAATAEAKLLDESTVSGPNPQTSVVANLSRTRSFRVVVTSQPAGLPFIFPTFLDVDCDKGDRHENLATEPEPGGVTPFRLPFKSPLPGAGCNAYFEAHVSASDATLTLQLYGRKRPKRN